MKDKEFLSQYNQKKDCIVSDVTSISLPKVEIDGNISLLGVGEEQDTQMTDLLPVKLEFDDDLKRAAALFDQRELGDAEAIYRKILKKNKSNPIALNMMGVIAYAAGNHEVGIAFIQTALAESPQYASAYSNLARIYRSLGNDEKAIEELTHALRLNTHDSFANYNMGKSLCTLGRFKEAISYAEKSLELDSNNIDNYLLMGTVFNGLNMCVKAISILDKATSLGHFTKIPEHTKQAIYNLKGESQMLLGSYSQALENFECGLLIDPENAPNLSNLGLIFQILGKFESSIIMFEKALKIDPNFAIAQKNLGSVYLSLGRIKDGLLAHEWRWKDPKLEDAYRNYHATQWDGFEDLSDKTILLWPEQGAEDLVIWASVIPKLAVMARHSIVEIFPKLVTLFERSFPNVEIREAKSDANLHSLDFDAHLPMGSLFLNFTEDLHEACDPFLVPDTVRVAYWRQRLEGLGSGPYIGISWKIPLMAQEKTPDYINIDDWAPVFEKNAKFINLQSGDFKNDIDQVRQKFGVEIVDFGDLDLTNDLDEVAALSAALDIAISVSTTVSAITAGVGTETWLLSWKEGLKNNILFAPRGPKVINFECSTVDTWESTFTEISRMVTERGVQSTGG